MNRLKDKIVFVTGAAGAIGAAVTQAVRNAGGVAITSDLNNRNGIDNVLDVSSESDWQRAISEIARKHNHLDGLVNAAGITKAGDIEETDFASWRQILSVNLDGTFLGCKHAFGLLKRKGGAIVNLSSVFGLVGVQNFVAYNASKGGVRLLTKSVALHGAQLDPQVRCNSVHPAFLEGQMVDNVVAQAKHPAGARARITRDIPLGRFGTPAEVADMCIYLLSDESRFVTGADFVIDGGLTAR